MLDSSGGIRKSEIMESAVLILVLTNVCIGVVMLLVPHMSPRRYLFAITVTPEFRAGETARAALRRYHAWVGAAVLLACAVPISLEQAHSDLAIGLSPLLPVVVGLGAFLQERSRMRAYAAIAPEAADAARRPPADGPLPRWITLASVPFAFPLAAALYLNAHWSEIPARYAIHWDLNGHANGWATKSVLSVYGPFMFAGGLMLLLLLMGLVVYYGSRSGPLRRPVLALMVATMYLPGLIFTGVGLMPLIHFPLALFIVPVLVVVLVALALVYRTGVAEQPAEATPDECWRLGGIYYNPADPALFVQKRFGIGYTFNFAHPLSWVILVVFLGGMAALILLLPRK